MDSSFLGELGIVQDKTKVYEVNQAAISLATSLSISVNSRHVVVRYSRVREAVANDIIDVFYVLTHLPLADMLTKIVPITNFIRYLPFITGNRVEDTKRSRQSYINDYKVYRAKESISG